MSETPRANDVNAIVAHVNKAFSGVMGVDGERKAAQDMAKAASETSNSHRVGALVALAGLSQTNNWTAVEIEAAVGRALDGRNDKQQSLVTFGAEIKKACNPHARQHVKALFALAQACFDAEKERKNKMFRKAFNGRAYHMAQRLIGEAIAGRVYNDVSDCLEFAKANDPTLDPKKIASRINAIKVQLAEMSDDFPHEGFQACLDFLGTLTTDELTRARDNGLADDDDAASEETTDAAETDDAPAGDILDEALNGLVAA